jgi:endoglucanase
MFKRALIVVAVAGALISSASPRASVGEDLGDSPKASDSLGQASRGGRSASRNTRRSADPRAERLLLNDLEYFESPGINVMAFQDMYPEGHQGGVSIIQNGRRVASNGDLRLGPTPGQWQPVPKQDKRVVDRKANQITTWLSYPDPSKNRKGFNPIEYPDLNLSYQVRVIGEGSGVRIAVDLDKPLPSEWVGRVGFNLELFPAALFGKTWYLGGKSGIFPRQPGGPTRRDALGDTQAVPMASGSRLSVAPETDSRRMIIESKTGELQLFDGRVKHNNGWFIVRSLIAANATTNAVDWMVLPTAIPGWKAEPVVHVSQVGYHPSQKKIAIIEIDPSEHESRTVRVDRVSENGGLEEVASGQPATWGRFLRFRYLQFDFTSITKPGMYVVQYGESRSDPFQISSDVFRNNVWQPTLEYFLPVQMCHMTVREQYKTWHGACHLDDARMAPVDYNHFDGYMQGHSTLTSFKPGETVPGLNRGGWHDAGDDDFRIESQSDEVYILAACYESFGVGEDDTTVDEAKQDVMIHQPDGKPDILEQVEHGVLTVLGGYKSLGRLYRGIIVPTLQQYVLLGDTANSTDNLIYDPSLKQDQRTGTHSARQDDRLVFTEQNPSHEYKGIAALAIAARVLKTYDQTLAAECLSAAEKLWDEEKDPRRGFDERMIAAVELLLTTRNTKYSQVLLDNRMQIAERIEPIGWALGRALPLINDQAFSDEVKKAIAGYAARVEREQRETPFGVPYKPVIWGAGWGIQKFGVHQYFLHRSFPDLIPPDYMLNALNFVLGSHPGENTASFASGVGARSMTIAYGFNRADWTYIPGGVVSGTALIRPDFPELKDFPFLWQQAEYVMGGGATDFMFLVLAADQTLNR